jgi:hypothetical protein
MVTLETPKSQGFWAVKKAILEKGFGSLAVCAAIHDFSTRASKNGKRDLITGTSGSPVSLP